MAESISLSCCLTSRRSAVRACGRPPSDGFSFIVGIYEISNKWGQSSAGFKPSCGMLNDTFPQTLVLALGNLSELREQAALSFGEDACCHFEISGDSVIFSRRRPVFLLETLLLRAGCHCSYYDISISNRRDACLWFGVLS